ncbi:MAG: hypothetical protein F6J87_00905 [Spirulina sp. SIO3F2]|nr:hypothetical protein [Spirulina sp. SIO3F2]
MARTVTIELPDELERRVLAQAQAEQISLEAWVLRFISQRLQQAVQSEAATSETRAAGREALMQFAGVLDSSHATGLDNAAIDADLARAYANDF